MKKLLAVVLVVACVLSMTACGSKSNGSAAPAGSSATTFKIGGIGPISGAIAIYGQNVMNAAQLAVEEVNAAGGINGFQIEYNFQDDEGDAEKAVNAYNVLKDWGMQLSLGTVTSTPCLEVAQKTKADNMFMITPSGTVKEITAEKNAYRVCFSDPDQGAASAKYIGQHKIASKIGVLYDSSNTYSAGIYETFAGEAKNQPFDIVAAEAYTSESNTDFNVQLQKCKEAGAELVFLPMYYADASLILKQADAMGYKPMWFGCDGLDGLLGVDNFDKALAEGVMLLTPYSADAEDALTKHFVEAYQAKFGDTPNQFAADAYDAIFIIKAALEAGNAKPSMSVSELGDLMNANMSKIKLDGVTGESMTWTEGGEPNKAPKAVVIENGAYKMME